MGNEYKEGTLRQLTIGEMSLIRSVFGDSINLSKVWIHCGSYLPFSLQDKYTAMTPNGELYFRRELYSTDYSTEELVLKHLFIHEMAHVWQYQNGMWVKLRGSMSWAVDYHYNFDGKKVLSDYSMEQQASIIADYYYLSTYGVGEWKSLRNRNYNGVFHDDIAPYYRKILHKFPDY
jgi:hypothetical protein